MLQQTYKSIELIVINDGSSDDSDAIIRELKAKHSFRYISHKTNKGIIATRNEGVGAAKGKYLIQLDADDWIAKNYVAETVRHALKHKVDIVYTQVKLFGRTEFTTNYPKYNLEYLKHNNFIHASSLVKRSVFDDRQYDKYLNDKWYEDWDLFLDACLDGAVAKLLNKPLLHYRKHEKEQSRSDDLANTFKELLVRHHILNKQNHKHPDQFWYFSSYIKLLEESISNYLNAQELENKSQVAIARMNRLQKRIDIYERVLPVKTVRYVHSLYKKIVN